MFKKTIFTIVVLFLLSGCSTFKTINTADADSPIVFSGTRLNISALNNDQLALTKFNTKPPKYPLADLPASFVADFFMMGITGSVATYDYLFMK